MKTAQIRGVFNALLAEQDGVTAIEYALLAALIFAVIVTAVGLVGTNLAAFFTYVAGLFP